MNYLLKFMLSFTFCLTVGAQSPAPEPYASVQLLPMDNYNHNWFQEENKFQLKRLIEKYQPLIVVELGSWLGNSTIYIAELLRGDGKVYAVDNWIVQTDIALLSTSDPELKMQPSTNSYFFFFFYVYSFSYICCTAASDCG